MKLEQEIFTALKTIYSDSKNKDRYGQVGVMHYSEGKLAKMLAPDAFEYLKSGQSVYGKFSTYGWTYGTYRALTITNQFYTQLKTQS